MVFSFLIFAPVQAARLVLPTIRRREDSHGAVGRQQCGANDEPGGGEPLFRPFLLGAVHIVPLPRWRGEHAAGSAGDLQGDWWQWSFTFYRLHNRPITHYWNCQGASVCKGGSTGDFWEDHLRLMSHVSWSLEFLLSGFLPHLPSWFTAPILQFLFQKWSNLLVRFLCPHSTTQCQSFPFTSN